MTTMADAFATHEAIARAAVQNDTWGHLRAEVGRKYKGVLLVAISEYSGDGQSVIKSQFEDNADAGPWFYTNVHDWLVHLDINDRLKQGEVYLWRGYYIEFKNGGYRFCGKFEKVKISLSI